MAAGLMLMAVLPVSGEDRTWTSADGERTMEAEYEGSADGTVTIVRKKDGKKLTFALEKLSEADRKWVAETAAAMAKKAEEDALRESPDNPYMALVTGEWARHQESGLKFRLFADRRLRRAGSGKEAAGFPLVIYLHGRGGDVIGPEEPWTANSFSSGDNYRKRPCYILVPQCPNTGGWGGNSGSAVLAIAKNLVKHLYVDPDRVYLTGYSMGGFGTFHLLAEEPDFFAAGAPVAGGGRPGSAASFKDVPVWAFHGAKDPTVNVEQSRKMVEALKEAGADPKYTEYPDGDHGITGEVYGDGEFHEWLFAQKRG